MLLAILTELCASSISFFLGLYVVGRIVRPLNRFDRVSDRNDKLERGSGYSKLRLTNNAVLQAVATSSHEEWGAAHQIGKPAPHSSICVAVQHMPQQRLLHGVQTQKPEDAALLHPPGDLLGQILRLKLVHALDDGLHDLAGRGIVGLLGDRSDADSPAPEHVLERYGVFAPAGDASDSGRSGPVKWRAGGAGSPESISFDGDSLRSRSGH